MGKIKGKNGLQKGIREKEEQDKRGSIEKRVRETGDG